VKKEGRKRLLLSGCFFFEIEEISRAQKFNLRETYRINLAEEQCIVYGLQMPEGDDNLIIRRN